MIRMDYDKTRACAKKLSGAADTCRQMNSSVTKLSSEIPACWQGASATAFSAELTRWKKETAALQKEIQSLSAQITNIANDFEEAEARLAAATAAAAAAAGFKIK